MTTTQLPLIPEIFEGMQPANTLAFLKYHQENPRVYKLFTRFSLLAAQTHSNFSARAVIHRIRWHSQIDTIDPQGFKVNNNHSPYYARMFERDHPQHAGFFRKRASVADEMGGGA